MFDFFRDALDTLSGFFDQFETDEMDVAQQALDAYKNGYLSHEEALKIVQICVTPNPTLAQIEEKERLEKQFR